MAGRLRSGSTTTRPARSSVAPVPRASVGAERRGGDAGGPDHGAAGQAMRRAGSPPSRGLVGHAVGVDAGHLAAGAHLDAEPHELLARALPQSFGHEAPSTRVGALEQHAPRALRRVDAAELAATACGCAISASVPAISTPVGPAPMTTKVSQASRARRRRLRARPPRRRRCTRRADVEGVGQRLQARARARAQSSWPK